MHTLIFTWNLSDTFSLKKTLYSPNSSLAHHWSCTMETLQYMCFKVRCLREQSTMKAQPSYVSKLSVEPLFRINTYWKVNVFDNAKKGSCFWLLTVTVFRFWLGAATPSRREIIRSKWDFEMYSGYRWAGKGLTLIYFPLSFPRLLFPNPSLHPGWPMTLAWMSLKMTTCQRLRRSQTSAGWAWTAMAQI